MNATIQQAGRYRYVIGDMRSVNAKIQPRTADRCIEREAAVGLAKNECIGAVSPQRALVNSERIQSALTAQY